MYAQARPSSAKVSFAFPQVQGGKLCCAGGRDHYHRADARIGGAFLDICFWICLLRFSCKPPMVSPMRRASSPSKSCVTSTTFVHVHNTPDCRAPVMFGSTIYNQPTRDLVTTFPRTDFNGRIGVIAPYRNQIRALQRGMWSTGLRHDGVEVSTVDGFQGR